MHILCIALRVSDQGMVCRACKIIWTLPMVSTQTLFDYLSGLTPTQLQSVTRLYTCCQNACNVHRPINIQTVASSDQVVDPEGGAQDVRRFSMRQDASSKNPRFAADGRFGLDLNVFFGDFLCAKESYPRNARKLCC